MSELPVARWNKEGGIAGVPIGLVLVDEGGGPITFIKQATPRGLFDHSLVLCSTGEQVPRNVGKSMPDGVVAAPRVSSLSRGAGNTRSSSTRSTRTTSAIRTTQPTAPTRRGRG